MKDRIYWKGLEELEQASSFLERQNKEFEDELPGLDLKEDVVENGKTGRRDFLKYLGFSVTAASIAASCKMPVKKAIPYVIKPEEITPGIANYYASTFAKGGDFASILVKTREGRPIKIEGNPEGPITKGGTSARVQASVLSLYDTRRFRSPMINGKEESWEAIDKDIVSQLQSISNNGGKISLVSSTIISPALKKAIKGFLAAFPGSSHIAYDSISYAGILDANEDVFGLRALPSHRFDKAKLIVSLGADFLGTWISPIEFTKQYSAAKRISKDKKSMLRHIQVESLMSLTGANADERIIIKPSGQDAALLTIFNTIAGKAGASTISGVGGLGDAEKKVRQVAEELWTNRGQSLLVSGSNDKAHQIVVCAINQMLGNYENTLDWSRPSYQRQGCDEDLTNWVGDLKKGSLDAVLLFDVNPVYDQTNGAEIGDALKKVKLSVSFAAVPDETTEFVKYLCPDNHYLESWSDAEPQKGVFTLCQPTIAPLFDTRQVTVSLLKWSGSNYEDAYTFLKENWEEEVFPVSGSGGTFNDFWNKTLHDGFFELPASSSSVSYNDISTDAGGKLKKTAGEGVEFVAYETVAIGDGSYAGNPWLQEMPDPVSKVTWGNYAAVGPAFAKKNKLYQQVDHKDYEVITISANGKSVQLPIVVIPGIADDTIGLALGYGRTNAGKAGTGYGENIFALLGKSGTAQILNGEASFEGTKKYVPVAQTQTHHNIIDELGNKRGLVKETTLKEYLKNPYSGNEDRAQIQKHLKTLYPGHESPGHHWELAIDLSTCTGCGACAVACYSENNVAIVGKEEVIRVHEMSWLRIDRYFTGNPENPDVVFQPMMCQHCDNAPCENVCPVAATVHSAEGLNQMAYNRCFGTRYCQNNCPYKVRRFNWFDYMGADSFYKDTIIDNDRDLFGLTDDLTRMVLNPDVTVRSRGVMEKCSFCVQRIQDGKLTAKKEGRPLQDGDIKTACMQACPADAIIFGDINNKESLVYSWNQDERAFKVIEEIHTLPSVTYLTKIRNREELA